MKKLVVTVLLAPMLAQATLTPNLAGRGSKTVTLSRNEICVIPKHLGGLKADGTPKEYSAKDLKNEEKLCGYDIKNAANTQIAACAKTNSTNPGVQFFEVPKGASVALLEGKTMKCEENAQFPKIKKLAKYKNSTSCSYTPSILSYYHVSRFLGDLNQVPVAVLRTMDLKTHTAIGETITKEDGTYPTWRSLLDIYLYPAKSVINDKKRGPKIHGLFTDNFTQTYGALQKNPGGEEKFKALFNGGADQKIRATNFRDQNPVYTKGLTNSLSIEKMGLTHWSNSNVQNVLTMQNVADMILMDTILSQEDRFGNLHYTNECYAIEKDQTGKNNVKKQDEPVETSNGVFACPSGQFLVKKLMMKDNDCGVNRANHLKDAGLLKGLRHFNPETLKKLVSLNQLVNTAEGKTFFMNETAMTGPDFNKFVENIGYAIATLKTSCSAGLMLDLDLDSAFTGEEVPSCKTILKMQ